jgi:hypothetical protein
LYACTIKETTNGRWRRARGQARKALEGVAKRRVETNGEIDVTKAIARIRQDQAQKVADEKAKEALSAFGYNALRASLFDRQ